MIRSALALALLVSCASPTAESPVVDDVVDVEQPLACPEVSAPGDDGEPAPHSSHHRVLLFDDDLVDVQVDVRVREMPDDGLRFFALQVNLDDVWAHGGLQGDMEANWGGLTSGDGYDFTGNDAAVLEAIQNSPTRLLPTSWEVGRWYRYRVTRGPLETLPAGEYAVLDGAPVVIDHPREMYRWDFTIEDVDTGDVVYAAYLHTRAAVIDGVSYWTETGYGVGCNDRLTVDWSDPLVTSASMGGPALPQRIAKSISQSTCPVACSTDLAQADHGGQWGTTQTFGQARAEGSVTGETVWLRTR